MSRAVPSWDGAGQGARLRRATGLYGALLRIFPPDFRAEYGGEMLQDFGDLWLASAARGRARAGFTCAALPVGSGDLRPTGAGLRFWYGLLSDVARSAPREWLATLRARRAAARGSAPEAPWRWALAAGMAVWVLYFLTLAPSIGFWDSGEYATVAHTLGIPHPPGNPLFVLLGHAWETLLAATRLSPAVRINLLAATASALAHVFWFLTADRLLASVTTDRWARRLGACAAVALSATAFTVWSQSNVNEKVYPLSLLSTALLTWLALRWRDTGRRTAPLVLAAFVLVLTATNHLMGVLVAPALVLFALQVDARALLRPRFWALAVPAAALALSVQLFLPLRAAQRPLIAEGDPRCDSTVAAVASTLTWGHGGCPAFSSVLRRDQYAKPPLTLDPTVYPEARLPRGPGLFASQVVNFAQYFDWQWGRSVAGRNPVFGGARPLITLAVLLLGLLALARLYRRDRAAALLLGTLFLTLSLGLVLYLNFKYGFSLERARFPDWSMHEVRERDYFFILGFSLWGVLAGMGLTAVWQWASGALERRPRRPVAARAGNAVLTPFAPIARLLRMNRVARVASAAVFLVALVPAALNWRWASRSQDWTARDWAYNILMSVEPYGILVTNGDNDSFPLWYAQNVEGIRTDVTLLITPYMNTAWYARQVRDLSRPCPAGVDPEASPDRIVCQRPFHPEQLPPRLLALDSARGIRPPEGSILPLSDTEIDTIASAEVVTPGPLQFAVGNLRSLIPAGTRLQPSDTFVAAIVQANLGQRPIHFMTPAPAIYTLGLQAYTVREGLTWRLADEPARSSAEDPVVAMPPGQAAAAYGAYVDVGRSDTLADIWLRRGRIADPTAPWVDAPNASVPGNYAVALSALAQAHAQLGDAASARRYLADAERWIRVTSE